MHVTEIITLIATLLSSGFVAMYLTQAIKRVGWPSSVKLILALIIAGSVGVATAWLSGDVLGITAKWGNLTAADVLAFGGVVYAAAATWYHHYFADVNWMQTLGAWPGAKK